MQQLWSSIITYRGGGILFKQDQKRGYHLVFGLLVRVLPGSNKQRARKPSLILS
jgi:hypothetical protein